MKFSALAGNGMQRVFSDAAAVLFFLKEEKEKNGGANMAYKKDGHFVSGPARRKSLFAPLPSSFLNLKSPENCLIEREGGSLPPSLFPSDSVAKLRIIVF